MNSKLMSNCKELNLDIMKKITFLLSLMTCTFGFAQNLVTNGDFQTGTAAPWYNNAANVVDLGGGNFVNQANVGGVGNPWSKHSILLFGPHFAARFVSKNRQTLPTNCLL